MPGAARLPVRPLTREAFRPFGDVIESRGVTPRPVNDGTAQRFPDLARLDAGDHGGAPQLGIFHATPVALPARIAMLERHPLASQAFVPLDGTRFLVVVAAGEAPDNASIHAFVTDGGQGVNYYRNTWHHPLLALDRTARFLVIDRDDAAGNCEVLRLALPLEVALD